MRRIPNSILESIDIVPIPSPPEILLRLVRTVEDEQATMGKLAAIVAQDPGLASQILSVSNSPALRLGKEVKIYRPKPITDTAQRGIGLSVVGSLAKREGILITCRSQIGSGTSIALLIPKNRTSASGQ